MRGDDIIKVRHTIRCECLITFSMMWKWLDHKRITGHTKKSHIVYYSFGDKIEAIKTFTSDGHCESI